MGGDANGRGMTAYPNECDRAWFYALGRNWLDVLLLRLVLSKHGLLPFDLQCAKVTVTLASQGDMTQTDLSRGDAEVTKF